MNDNKIIIRFKGGPGSGNHGHSGRPGKIGGSSGGGGGSSSNTSISNADIRHTQVDYDAEHDMYEINGRMYIDGDVSKVTQAQVKRYLLDGNAEAIMNDEGISGVPKSITVIDNDGESIGFRFKV